MKLNIAKSFLKKSANKNDKGRTMMEMLGTLSVVGVLSVSGIIGYSYAMDRYRANQTINDIKLRSASILIQKDRHDTVSLDEWPEMGSVGYPIIYNADDDCIQVSNVPDDVCHMIFRDLTSEMIIGINGKQYNEYKNICTSSNAMHFYVGMSKDEFVPDPCPTGTAQNGLGAYAVTKENVKCYCEQLDMIYKNKECIIKQEEGCKNNNECNNGEYCNIPVYTGAECPSATIVNAFRGECEDTENVMLDKPSGAPFYVSKKALTWQSAKNLCSALGKSMVSLTDWQCAHKICRTGSGCECKDNCSCRKVKDKTGVSDIITQMAGYSSFNGWVTNSYSSCYYYSLNKSGGYVGSAEKTKMTRHAICK